MQSFDFRKIVKSSTGLFRMLNMDNWADEIEKTFEIDCEADDVLDLMREHHLSHAMLMPSYNFQREHDDELVIKLKSGIEKVGYAPFISDSLNDEESNKLIESNFNITLRKDSPYALFYSWDMHQDFTYGLSGRQVKMLFSKNCWTGMTAQEFLITQARSILESDSREKLWSWLVDSSNESRISVGYMDNASLKVYTCKHGSTDIRRGALVTYVLPLKEVKEYIRD